MEVVDRLGWDQMYVFDLNIHYDAERSASTYKMATRGLPDFVKYFGDTKLSIVTDFDAQLYFIMDQIQGKDFVNYVVLLLCSFKDNFWNGQFRKKLLSFGTPHVQADAIL